MSTMTVTPLPTRRVPAQRPVARPASQGQVRLTRRGRVVVVALGLLVLLAIAVVAGAGSAATERPGTPEPTRTVVVGPGDTLWEIAAEVAPAGEVRSMVDRIERLNALESAMVQAGQRLQVPVTTE